MTPRRARKVRMARAFLRMRWPTVWEDHPRQNDPYENWRALERLHDAQAYAARYLTKHAPRGMK